jgi:hypothetical protein
MTGLLLVEPGCRESGECTLLRALYGLGFR